MEDQSGPLVNVRTIVHVLIYPLYLAPLSLKYYALPRSSRAMRKPVGSFYRPERQISIPNSWSS
jgi:hypothetical protein